MTENQAKLLDQIRNRNIALSELKMDYFNRYSDYENWQFWLIVILIIVPLVVLFFKIDRGKALLLGFFGLNYHLWFAYTNIVGVGQGYWDYSYSSFPFLPGFLIDSAFVPICYMFLYQWTLNRGKNVYLYSLFLSLFFAFIFKPIMVTFDFFTMYDGINYFYLFIFYYAFFLVSKLITNLFIWFHKKSDKSAM